MRYKPILILSLAVLEQDVYAMGQDNYFKLFIFSAPTTTTATTTVESTTAVPSRTTTSGFGNITRRSDVECGSDFIRAEIPKNLLGEGSFTLQDPSCTVRSDSGENVVAQFGLSECGTVAHFTPTSILYKNFLNNERTGQSVPIECEYSRSRTVSFSYRPVQRQIRFYEKSLGSMDIEMKQYTNEDFQTVIPPGEMPRQISQGNPVFIGVSVSGSVEISLLPNMCIVTASPSPLNSESHHVLIEYGCKRDKSVVIYDEGRNGELHFSFDAYPIAQQSGIAYVHCGVLLCNGKSKSSRCAQGCKTSDSRTKRSVSASSDDPGQFVSGGPFITSSETRFEGSAIVILSCAVAVVSLLVAVVAVIVAVVSVRIKRRAQRLEKEPQ